MIEPSVRESDPDLVATPPPEPPSSRRPASLPAIIAAAVLVGAMAGGAVAAAVSLSIIRGQSRTNPQTVDLHNNVTISASDAVTTVAAKALPAVVEVVTGTAADGSPTGGSGFFVTSDGFIVTAVPVVAGSTRLTVLVAGDPKPHAARLIDYDCQAGYAVLKADGITGAPTLAFGDSAALKPGETLVALGRGPQGAEVAPTVAAGLSQQAAFADPADPTRQILVSDTVAAASRLLQGTGGAPLLNVGGQVVGITLPAAPGTPTGAAPASMMQPGVQAVVSGGALTVGGLGATWLDASSEQAALGAGVAGAQLASVDPGGPAESAGLAIGDVITQVDDLAVDAAHPLSLDLRTRFQPGQRVTITYVRSGKAAQAQLTLASEHPTCV